MVWVQSRKRERAPDVDCSLWGDELGHTFAFKLAGAEPLVGVVHWKPRLQR